jgi:transposase
MSSPAIPLFIGAFIDGLDVAAAGLKRVKPKMTGRPGYAPGDLLKFSIYGYLNRVRSSRRLAAECPRNIEIIGLHLGMDVGNETSPTRSIVARKSRE